MYSIKLNIKDQLKTLEFTIIVIVVVVSLTILNFKPNKYEHGSLALVLAICVGFTIFVLPSLLLYIQYLYFSKGLELFVDRFQNTLKLTLRNASFEFEVSDIQRIVKTCSYPVGENRICWLATDLYYYFEIELKNGNRIIITSLMSRNFEIYGIENVIKKNLIAFILPLNNSILNKGLNKTGFQKGFETKKQTN